MAVFPNIEVESIVQVSDRTRLNVARSISTDGETDIAKLEVQPEATGNWVDVTSTGFLDWEFQTPGTKIASVRVTDGASATYTKSAIISALSSADDNLFSSDSDLTPWEPRILEYVQAGRSTFKNIHREAQTQILDWFDARKIWDIAGNRLTAKAVVDTKEVQEWSKFLTLQIIFEGISNSVEDVFSAKANKYAALSERARNRAETKVDLNGDGTIEKNEQRDTGSISIGRS